MTGPADGSGLLPRTRRFPCHSLKRRLVKAELHSWSVRSASQPLALTPNTFRILNHWPGSNPTSTTTTMGYQRMANHVLANISSGFPTLLADKRSNTWDLLTVFSTSDLPSRAALLLSKLNSRLISAIVRDESRVLQ